MSSAAVRGSVVWERKNRARVGMERSNSDLKCIEANKQIKRPRLVSYKELPEYMKDNECILNYYRANWSIKSLFRWHNEALNIWTHLIGFVFFLFLAVVNLVEVPHEMGDFLRKCSWSYPLKIQAPIIMLLDTLLINLSWGSHHERLEPAETYPESFHIAKWSFYAFLTGLMLCLILCTIYRLFCCHSHSLNLTLLKMDYVGIITMIITSYFPPIYYIFRCSRHFQIAYLTTISVMGSIEISKCEKQNK